MKSLSQILLLVIFLQSHLILGENKPITCLNHGACYIGSWVEDQSARYASFQGIKYGQSPIGNLRFKVIKFHSQIKEKRHKNYFH